MDYGLVDCDAGMPRPLLATTVSLLSLFITAFCSRTDNKILNFTRTPTRITCCGVSSVTLNYFNGNRTHMNDTELKKVGILSYSHGVCEYANISILVCDGNTIIAMCNAEIPSHPDPSESRNLTVCPYPTVDDSTADAITLLSSLTPTQGLITTTPESTPSSTSTTTGTGKYKLWMFCGSNGI